MAIAEAMKSLTEGILASHDARVAALSDLVAATHKLVADARKTIKGFASDRKNMSAELAEALSNFAKDLTKNVGDLLKLFAKNHQHMSEEQRKNLGEFVKTLTKDISTLLNGFNKGRKDMSEELKRKLNKEVRDIRGAVKGIVSSAQALISGYRIDFGKARRAWQGMASAMAKAREEGIMPKIEAGESVTTVEEEVKKKKRGRKRKRG